MSLSSMVVDHAIVASIKKSFVKYVSCHAKQSDSNTSEQIKALLSNSLSAANNCLSILGTIPKKIMGNLILTKMLPFGVLLKATIVVTMPLLEDASTALGVVHFRV